MSAYIIAWTGVAVTLLWALTTILVTYGTMPQYKRIIEGNKPTRAAVFWSLFSSLISLVDILLYIPLLIADFKLAVLIAVLFYFGLSIIDIKRNINKKQSKSNLPAWLLFFILVLFNLILRISPYAIYLIL